MSLLRLLSKHSPQLESSLALYITICALCFLPVTLLVLLTFIDHMIEQSQPRGCRKLGLRVPSNLSDEHDELYSKTKSPFTVKSLWIFPIKSCKGVELNKGTVVSTGLRYDRHFSFAQLKTDQPRAQNAPDAGSTKHQWWFVTQRTFPLLATIRTEVWIPDASSPTYSKDEPSILSGGVLVIKYPYVEDGLRGFVSRVRVAFGGSHPEKSVEIPFKPTAKQIQDGGFSMEKMKIWNELPESLLIASTEPMRSAIWLEEIASLIGVTNPLGLFRVNPVKNREVFRNAPRMEQLGHQAEVGFADAYPVTIINLASVHSVAQKLPPNAPKLSARRFRMNVNITGPEAYEEDSWTLIKIGESIFHVACRTTRCQLPNVDQDSGIANREQPYKTLQQFRKIDKGAPHYSCLGMHMVPASQFCEIRVGDVVEVLQTGEHFHIKQ